MVQTFGDAGNEVSGEDVAFAMMSEYGKIIATDGSDDDITKKRCILKVK